MSGKHRMSRLAKGKKDLRNKKNRLERKNRQLQTGMGYRERELAQTSAKLKAMELENARLKKELEKKDELFGIRCEDVADLSSSLARAKHLAWQKEALLLSQIISIFRKVGRRMVKKHSIGVGVSFGSDASECHLSSFGIVLSPQAIIQCFCELLGIENEEKFWENLNCEWLAKLQARIKMDKGVVRDDHYAEFGGKLTAQSRCAMPSKPEEKNNEAK